MRNTPEFDKRFLESTDHTGRFVVVSQETGCKYYVEPTDPKHDERIPHGDINPATGKLEGSYGLKYKGSIKQEESLITPENGFDDIHTLEPGVSPHGYIEALDKIRFNQGWRNGLKPDTSIEI